MGLPRLKVGEQVVQILAEGDKDGRADELGPVYLLRTRVVGEEAQNVL